MDTEQPKVEETQERKAFREKMEAQLREWNAKIDLLKAKADKAEADAKIEYHQRISELRKKRDILQVRLAEFRGASGEAWKSLKEGVQKAGEDLKTALETAIEKFK